MTSDWDGGSQNGGLADGSMAHLAVMQLDRLAAMPLAPGLYLVSTPIGHLCDISLRALSTLARAHLILCEDTRHSRRLLATYGIKTRLDTYHDFSDENDRLRIASAIEKGRAIALISDAGTPLISDPGYKLVRYLRECGLGVFAIPGPSAALAALVVSGLPTDRFVFAGFLPVKAGARRTALAGLLSLRMPLILYETAPRLARTLELLSGFEPRPVVIARELTKRFEEILAGDATTLLERVGSADLKGEIVLVIGDSPEAAVGEAAVGKALVAALRHKTVREAVDHVSETLGVQRKKVYNLALSIRNGKL